MEALSAKEYLQLKMPTEDLPVSDQRRISLALETLGYDHVVFPQKVLRKLYPLCRNSNFDITVTLVRRYTDWVVTDVEAGDRRAYHYGLAVDYGSTTIVMQLVDLNSGTVIAEKKVVNGQTAYGTDILTRITYCMEGSDHPKHLQQATIETFHQLLAAISAETGIDAANCPVP